jgi:hypothetical protein
MKNPNSTVISLLPTCWLMNWSSSWWLYVSNTPSHPISRNLNSSSSNTYQSCSAPRSSHLGRRISTVHWPSRLCPFCTPYRPRLLKGLNCLNKIDRISTINSAIANETTCLLNSCLLGDRIGFVVYAHIVGALASANHRAGVSSVRHI